MYISHNSTDNIVKYRYIILINVVGTYLSFTCGNLKYYVLLIVLFIYFSEIPPSLSLKQ